MTSLFPQGSLAGSFAALRDDLLDESGPRISTMRNYRFAILVYAPRDEVVLRTQTRKLKSELESGGWAVLTLSLQELLLNRLRAEGSDVIAQLIEMERAITEADPTAPDPFRGLTFLGSHMADLIEGPTGLAADVSKAISRFTAEHPDKADRTVVLLGRAGALFPYFRSSALLKHLDGVTHQHPVVLLYPGERHGEAGLSFMGRNAPDRDYRPRIYG